MMKKLSPIFLFMFFINSVFAQIENVELLGHSHPYPTQTYSDCWGYVDPQGREYAIMGVNNGTVFFDVTNPAQPVNIGFIPGPNSTWRDIKTHSHYAYITTEGSNGGLQIVDLSNVPNSVTLVNTITTWFRTSHNIFIDNGFAYVIGGNSQTGGGSGMHILDLSNPTNPTRTAYYGASGYIHDVFIWDDTAVVCAGRSSGGSSYHLVNLTNKSNPVKISESAVLPGIYAHSGWMTEDKRYFIAAEEFNVRDIIVYDLIDRTSWNIVVPQWQMPGNSPIHNLFVKGNYAHISYYKDGYVVLDVSNPTNLQRVGWYDTYPSNSGTYNGAWGAYPYLPSGNVIVSDIQTGLYIFKFLLDQTTPVELSSFSYNATKGAVELNWSTSTETNNSGFLIEKSYDNLLWNELGFVGGNGTTTEKYNYSFVDYSPKNGQIYYRLIQKDYDGTEKIYGPLTVEYTSTMSFNISQNYPNPFNPTTNIKFTIAEESIVKIDIYNITGEKITTLVNEVKQAGSHSVEFNGKNLTSGVYIASIQAGENFGKIKMILNK